MPDFTRIAQQIELLTNTSQQLLLLAEQERWDDLILAWPTYEQASAGLPVIDWAKLDAKQSASLQQTLLQLQTAHDALLTATLAWRAELQEILQSTVQSRKLNNMYR